MRWWFGTIGRAWGALWVAGGWLAAASTGCAAIAGLDFTDEPGGAGGDAGSGGATSSGGGGTGGTATGGGAGGSGGDGGDAPEVDDYFQAVTADGPLHYWRLGESPKEEGVIGMADSGASRLHGSYVGSPGTVASLVVDTDPAMDTRQGGHGVIELFTDLDTGFTVELWYRTGDRRGAGPMTLVELPGTFSVEVEAFLNATEQVTFTMIDGSMTAVPVSHSGLVAGETHYVVASYPEAGNPELRVDDFDWDVALESVTYSSSSSGRLYLGTGASATGALQQPFRGFLDEVALYTFPFTTESHYADGLGEP